MNIDIRDRRVLLYYVVNIFLVLNMMIILFSGIVMLSSGEIKSVSLLKFIFSTLFFTLISKGIIGLIMRLNRKEQVTLFLMSLIMSLIVVVMSSLTSLFHPQIILQFTLLLWGVYTILYNYIVLKSIRQYIPLVVLTSVYAFFSLALFVIMFMDIYKLFFIPDVILTGIISIVIVFVSLEMLQLLAYVFIPEYYAKNIEVVDLFDEIAEKYDIRIRDQEEKEEIRNKRAVERRMIERQKQAEREKLRAEREKNRKKLKAKIKPLTKKRLDKHVEKMKVDDKDKEEN